MTNETTAFLQAGGAADVAIARDAERAVGELARMIAIDTSFPPGRGYPEFADLMEDLTRPLGFEHRRIEVPEALWRVPEGPASGPRINLLATRPTGKPVCGLYFHVDTVPAAPGWRRDPFHLARDDERLYGLGTSDMKGTIAAVLLALRAAEACGIELAYDPVLLFCTDEEGGLYPGIRYLAEQGFIEGHILSFNGGAAARIWAGCFGSLDLSIEIQGRAAHSGDASDGVNAIEAALPLLNALQRLKAQVETRTSTLPPPPALQDRPLTARLNVTAAHGGAKGSSIPGRFTLLVNRRYAPEERFDVVLPELERTVAEALNGSGALGWTTRVVGHLAPVSDPTGPHWPRWQAALSEGFGWPIETFRAWGASSSSDMGWVQAAGIKEILLGGLTRPGCGAHGPDEHTTLEDVMALARSILLYLSEDFLSDDLIAAR